MKWLTIVIGIVIGYMIYQKKQQSSQSEYAQDTNETNSYSYTARSMQNDLHQGTGSADERREINEAVVAGERALESLRTAKSKLDSARAWGIYDMLGGGFLSSMIKHGQIGKANEWMEQANYDLRNFATELRDVPGEYEHGHKVGYSRDGLLGTVHYDEKGHRVGVSHDSILGYKNHYDNKGHKVGYTHDTLLGKKTKVK